MLNFNVSSHIDTDTPTKCLIILWFDVHFDTSRLIFYVSSEKSKIKLNFFFLLKICHFTNMNGMQLELWGLKNDLKCFVMHAEFIVCCYKYFEIVCLANSSFEELAIFFWWPSNNNNNKKPSIVCYVPAIFIQTFTAEVCMLSVKWVSEWVRQACLLYVYMHDFMSHANYNSAIEQNRT